MFFGVSANRMDYPATAGNQIHGNRCANAPGCEDLVISGDKAGYEVIYPKDRRISIRSLRRRDRGSPIAGVSTIVVQGMHR
jgi:hypothetical protein